MATLRIVTTQVGTKTVWKVAPPPQNTFTNVTEFKVHDIEADTSQWFGRDRILSLWGKVNGSDQPLIYHPGNIRAHLKAAYNFANFLCDGGLIFTSVRNYAANKAQQSAMAFSVLVLRNYGSAVDAPNQLRAMIDHLGDADSFPDEGYYTLENGLIISGRIYERDLS